MMAMRLFSKDTSLHEIAIFGQQVIERTNFYCEQNRAILRPLLNNLLRCESGFADPSAWDDADLSDPEPESPPQPVDYLSREEQAELKNLERAVVRNQHLLYVAALRHKVAEQHIELARQEAMPPPSPPQPTHEPPRIEPAPPEPQSPEPPAPHVAAGEDLAVPPAETSPDDDEFMVLFGRSPVAADDDSPPNTPAAPPDEANLNEQFYALFGHSPVHTAPAEPATVEPTHAEPAHAEPATVEPATGEPTHAEPAEPAPVEPATVEPTHVEPTPVEPAHAEPAHAEPAHVEPTHVEPTPTVAPVPVEPPESAPADPAAPVELAQPQPDPAHPSEVDLAEPTPQTPASRKAEDLDHHIKKARLYWDNTRRTLVAGSALTTCLRARVELLAANGSPTAERVERAQEAHTVAKKVFQLHRSPDHFEDLIRAHRVLARSLHEDGQTSSGIQVLRDGLAMMKASSPHLRSGARQQFHEIRSLLKVLEAAKPTSAGSPRTGSP
jgi:hypothetical protein